VVFALRKQKLKTLVQKLGQRYSEILGINVNSSDDKEVFKWFLAAVLFGAPITESSVLKTYRCFENHGVLTPKKIVETGWQGLVKILDEGSYARYDYKTADKLLIVNDSLNKKYGGSLNKLHREAADSADLEKRLKELGKGIGDVTVSIFLRELRGVWGKADPKPTPLVVLAAKNLGIIKNESPEKALVELKDFWKRSAVEGVSFVNLETALLRWGKDWRRKKQH
jgi:hypothetical protein